MKFIEVLDVPEPKPIFLQPYQAFQYRLKNGRWSSTHHASTCKTVGKDLIIRTIIDTKIRLEPGRQLRIWTANQHGDAIPEVITL